MVTVLATISNKYAKNLWIAANLFLYYLVFRATKSIYHFRDVRKTPYAIRAYAVVESKLKFNYKNT